MQLRLIGQGACSFRWRLAKGRREAKQDHWQVAMACLLSAADKRGPIMMARVAMMRTLQAEQPDTPPEPRRKCGKNGGGTTRTPTDLPDGQRPAISCPAPREEIFLFSRNENGCMVRSSRLSCRGVSRVVTNVRRGAVDATMPTDERRIRGGEVVWSWHT
jgi:hypothetical protein